MAGKSLSKPATESLHTEEAGWSYVLDHEPDLIEVGGDHDSRTVESPRQRGKHGSEAVVLDRRSQGFVLPNDDLPHRILEGRRPRGFRE